MLEKGHRKICRLVHNTSNSCNWVNPLSNLRRSSPEIWSRGLPRMFNFDRDGSLLGERAWEVKRTEREIVSKRVLKAVYLFIKDQSRTLDTSGSLWMHLSERSIVAILSNNVLSTKEQGLSAPTMSAQKLNAHSPALLVKRELYISNPERLSRTDLSILATPKGQHNVRTW